MTEDEELEEEIRRDFLDESLALLDQCEESFMKLTDQNFRVKELERIFRMVHSIKGAAGSIGFKELTAFTHVVEDCLSLLRNKPDIIDKYVISILLRSSDEIKHHIEMIRANDNSPWNVQDLKSEIERLNIRLSGNYEELPDVMPDHPPLDSQKSETPKHNDHHDDDHAPQASNGTQAAASIRVDADRIEKVLNISGELLV